jgi:hypothetical protein
MSWLDQIGGAINNFDGYVHDNAAGLGTTAAGIGLMAASPFDGGSTLVPGAGLTAAGVGALASKSAADTQANAATQAAQIQAQQNQQGLNFQQNALNQQQQNAQPWLQAGQGALGQIQQLNNAPSFGVSDFQQDPGYAFRLSEGMKALQNSAASRGGALGGNNLEAISNYAQNSASQEYQNAFQRYQDQRQMRINSLQGVAGLGAGASQGYGQGIQNAGNNASNLAMSTGNALAGGMTGAANANAAGMIGAANALSSGASSYINYNQSNNLINALNRRAGFNPDGSPITTAATTQPAAQSYDTGVSPSMMYQPQAPNPASLGYSDVNSPYGGRNMLGLSQMRY